MKVRKRLEGLAREVLWDCAAAFMIAAGLSVFAAGADFAPGGVNGLSLIVRHLFGLPMGAVSLVLNGPVILVTYKLLGRDFLLRSLKSMVICAVFMDYVIPFVPPYHGNQLLAALFAGAFNGAGSHHYEGHRRLFGDTEGRGALRVQPPPDSTGAPGGAGPGRERLCDCGGVYPGVRRGFPKIGRKLNKNGEMVRPGRV